MGRLSLLALFFSAILDTALFGLPTGPLVALASYADPERATLFVLVGAVGSALGAMVPFGIGRLASDWALRKWPKAAEFEHRFVRQRFLSLALATALPLPTKPLMAAAGLFHVPVLLAFPATVLGRSVRFGVEALIVLHFGPAVLTAVADVPWQALVAAVLAVGLLAWSLGWRPLRRWARS